ncbi:hypothetical protein MNBD_NITROSPINAE01-1197 [hydrothermal vent metagenome]|uniref:Glycosyltransferase RgtA/B/C/D-like domain-containing protein n=1 Tax=hydrothermal vent metagenome TaxID=652676 RepID=A0A3B1C140_9ZZZZ
MAVSGFRGWRIPSTKTLYIILGISMLMAVAFRAYHLPMLHFINDMVSSLLNGAELKENHFLMKNLWLNSFGLPNPPMWSYIMGLFALITKNPLIIAGVISTAGFISLVAMAFHLIKNEPFEYAVLATSVLAVNTTFFFYGSILWHPTLLIAILLVFHIKLNRFLHKKQLADFVWLSALAALASQLHLSGVLLFPAVALVFIVYRRSIGAGGFLRALLAVAIVCAPYTYIILSNLEVQNIFSSINKKSGFSIEKTIDVLKMICAINSPRIFLYWLGETDFSRMLFMGAGKGGSLFLMSTAYLLEASFVIGWFKYLWLAVTKFSFFPYDEYAPEKTPMPFIGAGFIFTVIVSGYILIQPPVFPHYLLIIIPSCACLAAWLPYRMWKSDIGKIIVITVWVGVIAFSWIFLFSLNASGGHQAVYGVSYNTLQKIEREIRGKTDDGRRIDLEISILGSRALSSYVLDYFFAPLKNPALSGPPSHVKLVIVWDALDYRFKWVTAVLDNVTNKTSNDSAMHFPASDLPTSGGLAELSATSNNIIVRKAFPGSTSNGACVVYGPYINLAPGVYSAIFRLSVGQLVSAKVAGIEVTANNGTDILGRKEIAGSEFSAINEWNEFTVPFTVDSENAKNVEFRVQYLGSSPLLIDEIKLKTDKGTLPSTPAD